MPDAEYVDSLSDKECFDLMTSPETPSGVPLWNDDHVRWMQEKLKTLTPGQLCALMASVPSMQGVPDHMLTLIARAVRHVRETMPSN